MEQYFFDLVFFEIYSVIPKYFLFKKYFFDIGPFISAIFLLFLIKFKAILKQLEIYFFELEDILEKIFLLL